MSKPARRRQVPRDDSPTYDEQASVPAGVAAEVCPPPPSSPALMFQPAVGRSSVDFGELDLNAYPIGQVSLTPQRLRRIRKIRYCPIRTSSASSVPRRRSARSRAPNCTSRPRVRSSRSSASHTGGARNLSSLGLSPVRSSAWPPFFASAVLAGRTASSLTRFTSARYAARSPAASSCDVRC